MPVLPTFFSKLDVWRGQGVLQGASPFGLDGLGRFSKWPWASLEHGRGLFRRAPNWETAEDPWRFLSGAVTVPTSFP